MDRAFVSEKKQQYMDNTFGQEDQVLKDIRSELAKDGKEGINIGPSEGAILSTLMRLGNVKTAVEIGTLYGYSAIWMARALPEDGHLYCLEKSEENFAKAVKLIGQSEVAGKITVIHGDALEVLEDLSSKGPFDMVFIDANKGGYGSYLEWARKSLATGGIVVGDNSFLHGYVYGEGREDMNVRPNPIKTMLAFNEELASSDEFESCILPTGEGMTLAVKTK